MSQIEKLIAMMRNAKSDVRFSDLENILLHVGYENVRQKGSHVHFRKQGMPSLTLPVHNGKVKKVYVRDIINLLGL